MAQGNYVKGRGILVGTFTEQELRQGRDKVEVEKMMKKTGYPGVNSVVVKKGGKPVGLRLYVCRWEDVHC